MTAKNRSDLSPTIYGAVTANQAFTHQGKEYIARSIVSNGDGFIDVVRADGTTMTGKMVNAGLNVFCCKMVTNTNGLTLEWLA